MSGSNPASVTLEVKDEAGTVRLATAIAARVQPGMLALFVGELGAGKSALIRGIVRTLVGDPGLDVPSPSFSLVQPYERADGTPVLHADFYRLGRTEETRELGLDEEPDAIVLIEWPQRDPDLMQKADLIVTLIQGKTETARSIQLVSPSGRIDCAALAS